MNDGADATEWDKAAAECEKRMATVPTMSADQKAKLCPFCMAHMTVMDQKDITMENYKTHTGWVTIATSTSPAGQKALNEYAASMKGTSGLLEAAAKDMAKPETMKSKM
jgi:hypothetical protein